MLCHNARTAAGNQRCPVPSCAHLLGLALVRGCITADAILQQDQHTGREGADDSRRNVKKHVVHIPAVQRYLLHVWAMQHKVIGVHLYSVEQCPPYTAALQLGIHCNCNDFLKCYNAACFATYHSPEWL